MRDMAHIPQRAFEIDWSTFFISLMNVYGYLMHLIMHAFLRLNRVIYLRMIIFMGETLKKICYAFAGMMQSSDSVYLVEQPFY